MSANSDTVAYTATLPIGQVRTREGHNPRRRFSQPKHEELCRSIREDGIIHPIAVRKVGDHYEIIAGERRWRAANEIGLSEIDAKVFECSELVARRMSRVENLNREDLTVPEEAYLAKDQVDDCEGDYDMAARTLGWSLSKLRHRLQLLHASSAVMDALMEGTILVGHAELLSTLPESKQDDVLQKVVQYKATIGQLREQLQQVSIPLDQAKFDKADCRDCPHNSSQQSSLFAEHIEGARCTNSACFSAKTATWIEGRRAELKDDYPVVELRTELMPGKTIPLTMHGSDGVGRAQFDACRGCAFRTCVIDNRVGTTTGNVDGPLCGNATCNAEKVAAYKATMAPPEATTEPDALAAETGRAQTSRAAAPPTPKRTQQATPKANASGPVAVPKAAMLAYQEVIRRAAGSIVTNEPRILLALAVMGLYKLGQGEGVLSNSDLPDSVSKMLGSDEQIAALLAMDKVQLQGLLVTMTSQFLTSSNEYARSVNRVNVNRSIVKTFAVDLAPHVVVDEAFLAKHTMPAIHALLDESGFSAWHKAPEGGEKKHKALMALGKAKLIEGIVAAGFDFTGYVPSGVKGELKNGK